MQKRAWRHKKKRERIFLSLFENTEN